MRKPFDCFLQFVRNCRMKFAEEIDADRFLFLWAKVLIQFRLDPRWKVSLWSFLSSFHDVSGTLYRVQPREFVSISGRHFSNHFRRNCVWSLGELVASNGNVKRAFGDFPIRHRMYVFLEADVTLARAWLRDVLVGLFRAHFVAQFTERDGGLSEGPLRFFHLRPLCSQLFIHYGCLSQARRCSDPG